MKAAAIVVAAGAGERMGVSLRKQYLNLEGMPILVRSLNLFLEHSAIGEVVAVIPPGEGEVVRVLLQPWGDPQRVRLVEGGATRQESVGRGLGVLAPGGELVCIHDAARPLASVDLLEALLRAALKYGAAVPLIPLGDTLKEVGEDGFIVTTPSREKFGLAQTPQVFRRQVIARAYREAAAKGVAATDDASLVEWCGETVRAVPGEFSNVKITTPRDLMLASLLLKEAGER